MSTQIIAQQNEILNAALNYADLGLAVFPVHTIINGKCSCGKDCNSPGKHPKPKNGVKAATTNREGIQCVQWAESNIGIATGAVSGIIVIDRDGPEGRESLNNLALIYGPLPPTVQQKTGDGTHFLFKNPGQAIKNKVGIAPGIDIRSDGGYIIAAPSLHVSGRRYEWIPGHAPGEIELAELPPGWINFLANGNQKETPENRGILQVTGDIIPVGARNETLFRFGCSYREKGLNDGVIWDMLQSTNNRQCEIPLEDKELQAIYKSILNYSPGALRITTSATNDFSPTPATEEEFIDAIPWPEPIGPEGFSGLAGRVVDAIMPHSEADPAAVLVNFLIGFGNLIGRTAHFIADREHYTNLFAMIVGDSATGKKGTSWSHVKRIFAAVEGYWAFTKTPGGLSSGEGLIWAIRDPIYRTVIDKKTKEPEELLEDAGEPDKRLLLIETEFGRALRAMQRDGNTLSATLRQAFDSDRKLQSLTKTSKAMASDPHVSLIGHITKTELITLFSDNDLLNGLGNRFLWVCSRQSKSLPFPEPMNPDHIAGLAGLIIFAENFAKNQKCIGMDDAVKQLWYEVYDYLQKPIPGILGVVLARGVPIVRRLAVIYALLDCSDVVKPVHIQAALAVWKYSEQSARFIFGEKTSDLKISKIEEGILDCLQTGRKTQTEISIYFNRNKKASELAAALQALSAKGKIEQEKVKEPSKDKPVTYWFLKK